MNFIPSYRGRPMWQPEIEPAPAPDRRAPVQPHSEPVGEPKAQDDRKREGGEERGYTASHPAGRGWTPLSRDLGIPGEHGVADPVAALGCSAVFTRELRVRFLDHLAFNGNVRAAAARVGVSHETAYRKRRQDAAFAALWDAALVHARVYSESQLATRALDGVEVPAHHRGELVGHQVKHDSRLLLAHLARLDKRVETDAAAQARAGRFDELLAQYAGHEAPVGSAEAAEKACDPRERADGPKLPPTRAQYVAHFRDAALDALTDDAEAGEEARIEAEADAMEDAGEEWDAWHDGSLALVEAIVEETGDPVGAPSVRCADTSRVNGGGTGLSNPVPVKTQVPIAPSDPPPFRGEVPTPAKAGGTAEEASVMNEGEGDPAEAGDAVPEDLPYEIKSAPARAPRISSARDRVTCVNPLPPGERARPATIARWRAASIAL